VELIGHVIVAINGILSKPLVAVQIVRRYGKRRNARAQKLREDVVNGHPI
jgi:hypothetical protein